jgi:hypothetical protein
MTFEKMLLYGLHSIASGILVVAIIATISEWEAAKKRVEYEHKKSAR